MLMEALWFALKTRKHSLNSHQCPDEKDGVENMTVGIPAEIHQHALLGGQAGYSSSGKHFVVLAIQPQPSPLAPLPGPVVVLHHMGGMRDSKSSKSMLAPA